MTTEEKIKVMQASIEGKQIQIKCSKEWADCEHPLCWAWDKWEYRVKPTEMYRPFKDSKELIDYWENNYCQHRPKNTMPLIWVKTKNSDYNYGKLIIVFMGDGVYIGTDCLFKPFNILFENYTFLDGSPCGVIDEN